MKLTSTLFFVLTLLLFNCSKKEDDNTSKNAILLYLVDQASGNCVVIQKTTTAASKTLYTATGYSVPKGGCNSSTLDSALYTSSASEAKTAADTYFDAAKAVYDSKSTCSALSTTITATKASTSEAVLTALQTALTSGAAGCYSGLKRSSSGKTSNIYLCKDADSITKFKATFSYQAVTSATTDMATKLTDIKATQTLGKSTTKFTDSAIAAARLPTTTELSTLTGINFITAFSSAAVSSCAKDILSGDASTKAVYAGTLGATGSTITDSEAAAVTSVIVTSLTCGYGDGFTESSTQYSVAQKCPSSYPSF